MASEAESPTDDSTEMAGDCSKDAKFYYITASGTGKSQDIATQVALITARKNALICIFGGKINYQSTTDETNFDVSTKTSTSVEVFADHMNWSGFEMIASLDSETDGTWVVKQKFRWSLKEINENKKRTDAIEKEREKNRALAARAEANKKLAEERKALLEKQRAELEGLKRQERELAAMSSQYDRALATLKKLKKDERSKDDKWLRMAINFGCGVTITDVKQVLGPPDEITVLGRQKPGTKFYPKYTPLIYFVYGKYALVAPVNSIELDDYNTPWSWVKKDADRYQITEVAEYVGGERAWRICRNG